MIQRLHSSRRHRGFTFLELILAIGLAVVLLAAVYAAAQMHFQQLEAGRQLADEAQLIRSLFRRIRTDIANTLTAWEPPTVATAAPAAAASGTSATVSSTGGSTGGASASTAGSATATASSTSTTVDFPSGGVMGESNNITLIVHHPPNDLDFAATGLNGVVPTVLRTVSYRIGTADGSIGADAGVSGLVRDVDMRTPDAVVQGMSQNVRSELMAPEVESINILYFDGTDYLDYWDTLQTGPPVAVTIEIGVRTLRSGFDSTAMDGLRIYSMTVSLPPAPAEASASSGEASSTSTGTGS